MTDSLKERLDAAKFSDDNPLIGDNGSAGSYEDSAGRKAGSDAPQKDGSTPSTADPSPRGRRYVFLPADLEDAGADDPTWYERALSSLEYELLKGRAVVIIPVDGWKTNDR